MLYLEILFDKTSPLSNQPTLTPLAQYDHTCTKKQLRVVNE